MSRGEVTVTIPASASDQEPSPVSNLEIRNQRDSEGRYRSLLVAPCSRTGDIIKDCPHRNCVSMSHVTASVANSCHSGLATVLPSME